MKNPFSKVKDFKQALESFVMKQQAYLLNTVIRDLTNCKNSFENPFFKLSRREIVLKNLCDKYYITQEDLNENIYYIDNIEDEKD